MTDYFANWKARLAGQTVKTYLQPQLEDSGYYRKPLTEPVMGPNGKSNGQKRVVGWVPFALWVENGVLVGLSGVGDDMRDWENPAGDEPTWSWICRNPIPHEVYKAVAEEGKPWPEHSAAAEVVARVSENNEMPPVAAAEEVKEKTAADYKAEIWAAIKNVDTIKVTSTEEASAALGSKNFIAELRLGATRKGEAIYKPIYADYKAKYDLWTPMVKAAEEAEKKINRAILTFQESERKRLAAEAAEIERQRQEQEEANARAADRAIARGEPEPEPVVEEEEPPAAPPAPAPVVPTYGTRTVQAQLRTFVTIADEAKVATYFRGSPELVAVLQTLAERAVKLGQTVPGITTRTGLI